MQKERLLAFFVPSGERLNLKLRLRQLPRFLFWLCLCFAVLHFACSSLLAFALPSGSGSLQEGLLWHGKLNQTTFVACRACTRGSAAFSEEAGGEQLQMVNISHTCCMTRRTLGAGAERSHPSTRPLAPCWCSALTKPLRKKPAVNYLLCLGPLPGLFETGCVLSLRRNAPLGRYWDQPVGSACFPVRGIHYFSV